jgi:hypothetical protein
MIVQEIVDAIEINIQSLLPTYKKASFVYDLSLNNRKQSKKIYAITPQSASNVSGSTLAITLDHSFDVTLSDAYSPKNDSDINLQDKILEIHNDIESLYKELFQRRLGLAKVLVVQVVDISSPEIDNDNNTVALTASFSIKYRKETT